MLTSVAVSCTQVKTEKTPPTAVSSTLASQPGWAEHSFDQLLVEQLERTFPGATIQKTGEHGYHVHKVSPATNFTISAHKAHSRCQADWSTCQEFVDHTLNAIVQATKHQAPKTLMPSQIRIVLRSTTKVTAIKSHRAAIEVQPFSKDASWLLAADSPSAIRLSVTPEELDMSWDEAWALAKRNLEPTFANAVTQMTDQFILYRADYAPSAMLFPAILEGLAKRAFPEHTGKLLAVAPEENILLYTIGGSTEVSLLRRLASAGAGTNFALSAQVMVWDDGTWHAAK